MTRKPLISIFKDADWLTYERIQLWATAFSVTFFFFLIWDFWTHSAYGLTDAWGEFLGRDFINYWSGALLAAKGHARTAYDINAYSSFQRTLVGHLAKFKMYGYPPVLMLLTLPLALCSFLTGFLLWTAAGYALCVKIFSKYVPVRLALAIALSAPACLLNIQGGQNGFFTMAFFAGGIMLLERRPILAGALLGFLCYKPQLGLMIPLALMAGGYWRSFIAAGITVTGLLIASTVLCGLDIWPAFIEQMKLQNAWLPFESNWWHRMPTIFCSLRNFHAAVPVAWAAQCVSTLCAALCVIKTWRGKAPQGVKNAVLVLAAFLATPYAWDYDMPVVIFALLCVAREAQQTGWLPWEKLSWMALVIMPLPVATIAKYTVIQPDAAILWWTLFLTLQRAKQTVLVTASH